MFWTPRRGHSIGDICRNSGYGVGRQKVESAQHPESQSYITWLKDFDLSDVQLQSERLIVSLLVC